MDACSLYGCSCTYFAHFNIKDNIFFFFTFAFPMLNVIRFLYFIFFFTSFLPEPYLSFVSFCLLSINYLFLSTEYYFFVSHKFKRSSFVFDCPSCRQASLIYPNLGHNCHVWNEEMLQKTVSQCIGRLTGDIKRIGFDHEEMLWNPWSRKDYEKYIKMYLIRNNCLK